MGLPPSTPTNAFLSNMRGTVGTCPCPTPSRECFGTVVRFSSYVKATEDTLTKDSKRHVGKCSATKGL